MKRGMLYGIFALTFLFSGRAMALDLFCMIGGSCYEDFSAPGKPETEYVATGGEYYEPVDKYVTRMTDETCHGKVGSPVRAVAEKYCSSQVIVCDQYMRPVLETHTQNLCNKKSVVKDPPTCATSEETAIEALMVSQFSPGSFPTPQLTDVHACVKNQTAYEIDSAAVDKFAGNVCDSMKCPSFDKDKCKADTRSSILGAMSTSCFKTGDMKYFCSTEVHAEIRDRVWANAGAANNQACEGLESIVLFAPKDVVVTPIGMIVEKEKAEEKPVVAQAPAATESRIVPDAPRTSAAEPSIGGGGSCSLSFGGGLDSGAWAALWLLAALPIASASLRRPGRR